MRRAPVDWRSTRYQCSNASHHSYLSANTGFWLAAFAAMEMRIDDSLDIPIPSPAKRGERLVALPVTTAMKEARRILNPRHPTKVNTMERALHALGKRVEVLVA